MLQGKRLKDQPLFVELVTEHIKDPIPSPFLLSAVIDMYEEKMEDGESDALSKATEVCV